MMLRREDLIGSWMLERASLLRDGQALDIVPFGAHPTGVLHYLPDGRMAVLIAHDGRRPIAGGRLNANDGDWLAAAQSFTGYAGTFTIDFDQVIHHVDLNSYPNDIGVDYPRIAQLDGDRLTLATPPDLPADQRAMQLIWRRYR